MVLNSVWWPMCFKDWGERYHSEGIDIIGRNDWGHSQIAYICLNRLTWERTYVECFFEKNLYLCISQAYKASTTLQENWAQGSRGRQTGSWRTKTQRQRKKQKWIYRKSQNLILPCWNFTNSNSYKEMNNNNSNNSNSNSYKRDKSSPLILFKLHGIW